MKKIILKLLKNFSFLKHICEAVVNQRSKQNLNFLKMTYNQRVKVIKDFHSLEKKKLTFDDKIATKSSLIKQFNYVKRFADDFVLNYAKLMKPKKYLQLGCWHMGEIMILKSHNIKSQMIATDQSKEFLEFLKKKYTQSFLCDVQFDTFDIENPRVNLLKNVEMISAIQVLSNIQPEGIKKFFKVLSKTKISLMVIGDMCNHKSLNGESYLSKKNYNWYHPYIKLAKEKGFECFFLPDTNFSDEDENRGVFIISRKLSNKIHAKAIGNAGLNFSKRQNFFLNEKY